MVQQTEVLTYTEDSCHGEKGVGGKWTDTQVVEPRSLSLSTRGQCHHCESSDPTEASKYPQAAAGMQLSASGHTGTLTKKTVFVKVTLDGIQKQLKKAERRCSKRFWAGGERANSDGQVHLTITS